ncbi:hypothetical protein EU527_02650 [Candidatus Thorarchaeota archaeon]|nr:MAG: hypothetical protein EU527_02650 [Candidatus Thorarchaeota archaeon]
MGRNYSDSIRVPEDGTLPSVLAFVIGLSYGIAGLIQVLVSLGILPLIVGFTDLVGGLLLIIVAAVFLTGVRPLSKDEQEGYAFIAVGYILAAILFALQVMVIITNTMGWALGYDDWIEWNISNDITPSFWMFIILMTSTGALWVLGNLRNKLRPKTKEVVVG